MLAKKKDTAKPPKDEDTQVVPAETAMVVALPPPVPEVDGFAPNPHLKHSHEVWKRWMSREGVPVPEEGGMVRGNGSGGALGRSNPVPSIKNESQDDLTNLVPHEQPRQAGLNCTPRASISYSPADPADLPNEDNMSLQQRYDNLQGLYAALSAEYATVKEQNAMLDESLERARRLQQDSDEQTQRHLQELGYLKDKTTDNIEQEARIEELEANIDQLKEDASQADKANAEGHSRLADMYRQKQALEALLKEQNPEYSPTPEGTELPSTFAAMLNTMQQRLQQAEERSVKLHELNAQLTSQVSDLEHQQQESFARETALDTKFKTALEQFENAANTLAKKQEELNLSRSQLAEKDEELKDVQNTEEEGRAMREVQNEDHDKIIADLRRRIAELEDELLEAQDAIGSQQEAIRGLQHDLDNANTTSSATKSTLINANSVLKSTLEGQQGIISDLKNDLEMQKSASDRKGDELRVANATLQEVVQELRERLEQQLEDTHANEELLKNKLNSVIEGLNGDLHTATCTIEDLKQREADLEEQVKSTTDELDEANMKLKDAESTIEDMKSAASAAKEDLEELRTKMQDAEDTVEELREKEIDLQYELEGTLRTLELSEEQVAGTREQLTGELEDTKKEVEDTRADLLAADTEFNELKQREADLVEQVKTLTDELEERLSKQQTMEGAAEDMQNEIRTLNNQLQEAEATVGMTQAVEKELQAELDSVRETLQNMSDSNDMLTESRDRLTTQLQDAMAGSEDLKRENDEVNAKLVETKESAEVAIANLTDGEKQLKEDLEEQARASDEIIGRLKDSLAEAKLSHEGIFNAYKRDKEQAIEDLEDKLRNARNTIEEMQESEEALQTELNTSKSSLQTAGNSINDMKAKEADLVKQMRDTLEQVNGKLRAAEETIENEKKDAKAVKAQLEEVTVKLQSAEAAACSVKDQLQISEDTNAGLRENQSDLEKELEDTCSKLQAIQNAKRDAEEEVLRLHEEIKGGSQSLRKAQEVCEAQQEASDNMIESLENDKLALEDVFDDYKKNTDKTIADLKSIREELVGKLQEAKDTINKLQSGEDALNDELNTRRKELGDATTSLQTTIEDLKQREADLEEQVKSTTDELDEANMKLKDAESTIEDMKSAASAAKEDLEELRTKMQDAENEVGVTKEQLQEAEDTVQDMQERQEGMKTALSGAREMLAQSKEANREAAYERDELAKELEHMKEQEKALQVDLARAEEEVSDQKSEIGDVRTKEQELRECLEDANSKIKQQEDTIRNMSTRIEEDNQMYDVMRSELETTNAQFDKYKKDSKDSSVRRRDSEEELLTTSQTLSDTLEELETTKKQHTATADELQAHKNKIEQLEHALQDMNDGERELREQLTENSTMCEDLSAEKRELQVQLDTLEAKNANERSRTAAEKQNLLAQMNELKLSREDLIDEVQQKDEANTALESVVSSLEQQLAQFANGKAGSETDNKKLREELAEAKDALINAEDALQDQREALKNGYLQELQDENEKFARIENKLKRNLEKMQRERDEMEAAAEESSAALAAATEEMKNTMQHVEEQAKEQQAETERLSMLLEEAAAYPGRSSHSRSSDEVQRRERQYLEARREYEERIQYLESALSAAHEERTQLQQTRQEEQESMRQAILDSRRRHSSESDQLAMDNEILKDEVTSLLSDVESTKIARSELEQAHATADMQLRQTAQEAEALRVALRQRQEAHEEEVRVLRMRLQQAQRGVPTNAREAEVPVRTSSRSMTQKSAGTQTLDLPKIDVSPAHARLRADFESKLRSIAFLANSRHLLVRDTHELIKDFTNTRTKAAISLTLLKGLKVDRRHYRELKDVVEQQKNTVEEMVGHEQTGKLIMDKYFTEWEKLHLGVGNKELPEPQRTDILHVIARLHATQEEREIIQQIAGLLVQYEKTNKSPRRSPRAHSRTNSAGTRSSHLTPRSYSMSITSKVGTHSAASYESDRRH